MELIVLHVIHEKRKESKMAHPIIDKLNRLEGKTPRPCSKDCEYFKFPHLSKACELSSVFSVVQGQMCYEFKLRGREER
jgi:hypothetical protein